MSQRVVVYEFKQQCNARCWSVSTRSNNKPSQELLLPMMHATYDFSVH
jgi:hypothetical protein